MNFDAPQTFARVVRLKTFAATAPDLPSAVASVETSVNAWLDNNRGERKVIALHWSVYGETATAAVWYVD